MAKQPYLVECSVTFTDYIVVYAESKDAAEDEAVDLIMSNKLDPVNSDHSKDKDLEINTYPATTTDLDDYPVYGNEKED